MKKFYLLFFALILVFAGAGTAHITKNEPKPAKQLYCCAEQIESCENDDCSVCVIGKASKKIMADDAVFIIRIENCDENIFDSQTNCNNLYQNIISQAEKNGINKDCFIEHEIVSRHRFSNPNEYKTIIDFEVRISDMQNIQTFEENILNTENCQILDLHYDISNINQEYETVLNEAIENANQKASELLHREGKESQIISKNVISTSEVTNSQPQIEIKAFVEILYK